MKAIILLLISLYFICTFAHPGEIEEMPNMTALHEANMEVSRKCGRSVCTLTPELVEGPYWVDLELIRYDISEDQTGIPMYLNITIIDVETCAPIEGAAIDIWHANATGVYSHIQVTGNYGGLTTTFLRGVQVTDANGNAGMKTILPGWYQGRAIHTHVKVHVDGYALNSTTFSGGNVVHTGQLFFDQSFMDAYSTVSPYSTNSQARLSLSDDMWYPYANGTGLWTVSYVGSGVSAGVYVSTTIAINTTATSSGIVATTSSGSGSGSTNGGGDPPGSSSSPSSSSTTASATTTTSSSSTTTNASSTSSTESSADSSSSLLSPASILVLFSFVMALYFGKL